MGASPERWVLGFDAACGTCRAISGVVERASEGRLEVVALAREDVTAWRRQAFGDAAPWKPTLLAVGPTGTVRGWTGPAMALLLLRRLGLRKSVRVLHALGSLKRRADGRASELPARGAEPSRGAVDRARFLRYAAGAAVAASMVLAGRTPSFAATERESAKGWVEANRANLPRAYDEVVAYPMTYRKAIYRALSAQDRSRLWAEQLGRHLAAHPDLAAQKAQVVRDALAFVRNEASFDFAAGRSRDIGRVEELSRAAERVFDRAEIGELFATLGTYGEVSAARTVGPDVDVEGCNCSQESNYCPQNADCIYWKYSQYCICGAYCCDCGFLWQYECDGICGCAVV
ncbi:MAG TPA: bacteriocin fulvocin C-related protein [Actinocrinis sp.]|nr:bacteriocin fulvocin C-related protein [Actinocrinis sp.]